MNLRKITSMTMLISFTFCILSSVILYIVPHGRVAYWADWHLWGLTKSQWSELHLNLGLIFLIAGILHIYYNWKPIVAYMKNRAKKVKVFTPSFNIALAVCLVIGFATYFQIPPVYSIINFSESIKDKASEKYGEPPYGHAELSSLKTFSKKTDLDLTKAKQLLKASGIHFTGDGQTILDIAVANTMSPKQIYDVMKEAAIPLKGDMSFPDTPAPGFGRKTLADICAAYSLHLPDIVMALKNENIETRGAMTIKEISASAGMDPHAFFEVLHRIVTDQ